MNTDVIVSHINAYVSLNEEEIRALSSALITKTIKQGELIVESGEPARYMIFMNAGYVMTYYTDKDGVDHVIQFASTGWWSGDLYSLSENTPTIYSTRALSAGEVLLFPKTAQDQLLEKYPKAGFEVDGKINRKDFGLVWNLLMETGGIVVGEEIKLHFNIQLTTSPAA